MSASGVDAAGTPGPIVPCAWTTTRPVTITPVLGFGVFVDTTTDEPVTLTCTYDRRVLGEVVVDLEPS